MSETGEFVMDPQAFNAKAHAAANERRHASGPDLFSVTAESHPVLHAVFEMISHDSGAGAGHANYSVPVEREETAREVERLLGTLSEDERNILACGDEDESDEILAEKIQDPEAIAMIDAFLDGFFEDWCDGVDAEA